MDTDTSVTRADALVARIAQIEKNTEETLKAVNGLVWGSQQRNSSTRSSSCDESGRRLRHTRRRFRNEIQSELYYE
jgi:hypothetical protein